VVSATRNEPILSLPSLSGDLAKLSRAEQAALDRVVSNRERPTDPFCLDRTLIMHRAGLVPDTWQAEVLTATDPRMMMLCTRQAGKSTVAAALGLLTALVEAPALVLILSPTQRQSSELLLTLRPRATFEVARIIHSGAIELSQRFGVGKGTFATLSGPTSLARPCPHRPNRLFRFGLWQRGRSNQIG
jgi:hypothetical protein